MRHVLSNRRREWAFISVAIWSRDAPSATASNTGEAGIGERRENDTAGNSAIEDA
jgi:long-subunit acyl-CoA synthetase (AMP-forming)